MKIAIWDIETWDLAAPFGPLLCASTLFLEPGYEDTMYTVRQDEFVRARAGKDMIDDRALCCELRDLLDTQHITMGWYSKGFDIPHLNSRLALYGERLLKPKLHIDGIWYYKGWRGLKLGSAKMSTVARELALDEQKPEVSAEVWMAARAGRREAMDEVVNRCETDVRITRAIIEKTLDMGIIKNVQTYP